MLPTFDSDATEDVLNAKKWRINTCEQKLVLCPILLQLPDQPAVHVLNSVALINDDVPPIGRPKIL